MNQSADLFRFYQTFEITTAEAIEIIRPSLSCHCLFITKTTTYLLDIDPVSCA